MVTAYATDAHPISLGHRFSLLSLRNFRDFYFQLEEAYFKLVPILYLGNSEDNEMFFFFYFSFLTISNRNGTIF